MRNSSDAWAVGHFTAPDQDDDGLNMLTERWNGTSWAQVSAPAVLHQDESLLAVRASSTSDAWAVGFTKTVGAAGRFPLAVHWNGTSWAIVPTPTLSGGSKSTLNGVAALSATDAWAVGKGRNGAALTEHWNGGAWTVVAVPTPAGATSSQLSAISARSPSDIWAVGSVSVLVGTTVQGRTLVEHWNGSTWSIVPSRNATTSNLLTGVAAVAANDVWAVGYTITTDGTNQPDRTLIEHWNGSSWSVVGSPNVGGNDNLLNGVSATPGDVWAVGSSNVTAHTLALRETG